MPHSILAHSRQLALTAAALSFLLSLWALYLDPVINLDGIVYVEAAEHFARGQWAAGFSVYKWPFYSIVIGMVSYVTGMGEGHAAYLVNACLYALIVLGFVAYVRALGGGGRVLWLAAFVALLHPDLNAFRSFVIRDAGYWACYLWSLAFYLAYVRHGRPRLLLGGTVLALAAFLFRIEGVVLLTILPACIYASRAAVRERAAAALIIAAFVTGAASVVAPLWQYVSAAEVPAGDLLARPLHHIAGSWSMVGAVMADRLEALTREFPGAGTHAVAVPVYLVTALTMILFELVKTVGVVFSGLIVYVLWTKKPYIPEEMRFWWWLIIGIQSLLVLQFGISNFFLAKRYPVALALALLPIVPFVLNDIWRRCESHGRGNSWPALVLVVLIAVESLDGVNVTTSKHYLKEAGLWLRANAPAASTIYSNDRILVYYSGLEEPGSNTEHSWKAAMREVWTDNWRAYDYFVLAMSKEHTQQEVLLFRRLDAEPVKIFSNDKGDRILIFRSG